MICHETPSSLNVWCEHCNWNGTVGDTNTPEGMLCVCPVCKTPVVAVAMTIPVLDRSGDFHA